MPRILASTEQLLQTELTFKRQPTNQSAVDASTVLIMQKNRFCSSLASFENALSPRLALSSYDSSHTGCISYLAKALRTTKLLYKMPRAGRKRFSIVWTMHSCLSYVLQSAATA